MKYRFYTCDVFTSERFGGNPLAVLPDAQGLTSELMQKVAREFNYSETTFVLPAEQGHTRRVRIFTPTREVPFAGHPNIGTAFTLASTGEFDAGTEITFEEGAGLVPITIEQDGQLIRCELKAPQPLSLGATVTAEVAAGVLSVNADDIVTSNHAPQEASVGLPFLMVELRSRQALANARINIDKLVALHESGVTPDIHAYIRNDNQEEVHARMFAPLDGVPEDPATGSANCALAGLLTQHHPASDGNFRYEITQGVEMGRPSSLSARTLKEYQSVAGVWVAGHCVMMTEGEIHVD